MDPKIKMILIVAAVVIVAVLVIAAIIARSRRTDSLRRRFGSEYDRTVREHGQGRGESVLVSREKRVEQFPLRELAVDERERFVTEWREVQARFVDDPRGAVTGADVLVGRVMRARGYPMSDFEQRAADISVTHPRVVDNYRAAREIALREGKGQATTEDLRSAFKYYRSLFDELLENPTGRRREVA
jgi:hypothetical protein